MSQIDFALHQLLEPIHRRLCQWVELRHHGHFPMTLPPPRYREWPGLLPDATCTALAAVFFDLPLTISKYLEASRVEH